MSTFLRALYTSAGEASSHTPAFNKGDRLKLIHKHDTGWLEIELDNGMRGYVSPAWVEELPMLPTNLQEQQEQPPFSPPAVPFGDLASPTPDDVPASEETEPEPAVAQRSPVLVPAQSGSEGAENHGGFAPTPYTPPPEIVSDSSAEAVGDSEVSNRRSLEPGSPQPQDSYAPRENTATNNEDIKPIDIGREHMLSPRSAHASKRVSNEFSDALAAKIGIGPFAPQRPHSQVQPGSSHAPSVADDHVDNMSKCSSKVDSLQEPDKRKPHRVAPPPPAAAKPLRPASAVVPLTTSPPKAPMRQNRRASAGSRPSSVGSRPEATLANYPGPLKPKRPPPPAGVKPILTLTDEAGTEHASPEVEDSKVFDDTRERDQSARFRCDTGDSAQLRDASARDLIAMACEGPLERRTLLDGSKEVKTKSWKSYYVVLAGPTLYFFKNEAEKRKGKKPLMFMSIEDKEVAHSLELTKKKYTFVVGNDQERILLQAPDEASMDTWVVSVSQACGTPFVIDDTKVTATGSSAATLDSGDSFRSPGSAASVKSKHSFIRQTLNKFLRARPKLEELKQKGIIEEAVFGGTIVKQVAFENAAYPGLVTSNIPLVVTKAIAVVDQHLDEQGIYRVSGNSAHIQQLVVKCNADPAELNLEAERDVHAITGLLKLYFRELAEPVFPEVLYHDFIVAAKNQDRNERLHRIKALLAQLPKANMVTLHALFQHMARVAEHGHENKMQPNNLAIVFGPTLLRQSTPSLESIVMDAPHQSAIVEEILRQVEWFFGS